MMKMRDTTDQRRPKLHQFLCIIKNNNDDDNTSDEQEENEQAEEMSDTVTTKRPTTYYVSHDILKDDNIMISADEEDRYSSLLFGSFTSNEIERKQEAVSDVVKKYEEEEEEGVLELTLEINGGYDPVLRISPSNKEEVSGKGVSIEKDEINTTTITKPSSAAAADTLQPLMIVEREEQQPSSSADTLQPLTVVERGALIIVPGDTGRVTAKRKDDIVATKEPKPSGDRHGTKRQRVEAEQINNKPNREIVICDQGNINNQSASIIIVDPLSKFVIKKVLKKSDVNGLSRLLLGKKLADEHINAFLNEEQLQQVKNGDGLKVRIMDLDKGDEHQLTYKCQPKMNGAHVFISNWIESFVRRRNLQAGDEIGMYFMDANDEPPQLAFSVLRSEGT